MRKKFGRLHTDPPTSVTPEGKEGSYLLEEVPEMADARRGLEQQGHLRLAKVNLRVRVHDDKQQAAPEGELQNNIKQHPALDNQRFDGTSPNETPEPALSSTARHEYENAKREQELQHRLNLGLQPKMGRTNTPTPTP